MKKLKLKLIITFVQTTTNQHISKQNLLLKIQTPQRVCFLRWSRNCFIDCFINFFIGQAVKSLRHEPFFPPYYGLRAEAAWLRYSFWQPHSNFAVSTSSSHVTDFNQWHAWIFYSERRLNILYNYPPNSGGYIPRREASRNVSTSLHRPWGGLLL